MASSFPRRRRRVRDLRDYHDLVLNWERTNACGNYLEEFRNDRRLGPILNINWVLLQVLDLEEIMKEVNISLLQASGYGEDLQVVCCLFRSLDIQPVGFVKFDEVWLPVEMSIELGCNSCAKIWFNEETRQDPELIQLKDIEQLEVIPFELSTLPMIHDLLRCGVDPQFWCPMGLLHIGILWWPMLCEEFKKDYFEKICSNVKLERQGPSVIYPAPKDTFAWTRYVGPETIRVVIIGQDPYPTGNKATGLAFSIPEHKKKIPPALNRVFDALERDEVRSDVERRRLCKDGDLTVWAKQGVLLLNTALTVREDEANSHADIGWKRLIQELVKCISHEKEGIVFLLWGKKAGDMVCAIQNPVMLSDLIRDWSVSTSRRPNADERKSFCREILHGQGGNPVLKCYHPIYNCQCNENPFNATIEHQENCMTLENQSHFSLTNDCLELYGLGEISWM